MNENNTMLHGDGVRSFHLEPSGDWSTVWPTAICLDIDGTREKSYLLGNTHHFSCGVSRLAECIPYLPASAPGLRALYVNVKPSESHADSMRELLRRFPNLIELIIVGVYSHFEPTALAKLDTTGWAARTLQAIGEYVINSSAKISLQIRFGDSTYLTNDQRSFLVWIIGAARNLTSLAISQTTEWTISSHDDPELLAALSTNTTLNSLQFKDCTSKRRVLPRILARNITIQTLVEVSDNAMFQRQLARNRMFDWSVVSNRIVSVYLALAPLELPAYVMLWIFDWSYVEEVELFDVWQHKRKIDLFTALVSWRRGALVHRAVR